MKLSVIFTLITVLPIATSVALAAGKGSVPVPKARATITVSPQALPATRLPSLEAAKKLPVARQPEIAAAALNESRRDLRNPDLGFSLLISAAPGTARRFVCWPRGSSTTIIRLAPIPARL